MMTFNKLILSLLFAITFQTVFAVPQNGISNKVVLASGDTIQIQALGLSDISTKIEEVSLSLNKIDDKLKDDSELKKTDSIISLKKQLVQDEHKWANENIEKLSTRDIEDLERKWKSYNKDLKKYQTNLNSLTKDLEKDNDFLLISIKTWELTNNTIKEQNGPRETISRVTEEITTGNKFSKRIGNKLNQISKIQNNITDLILLSEKVLDQLETQHLNWQSEYLRKDSPAIWAKSDTANIITNSKEKSISLSVKDNIQTTKEFLADKTETLYLLVLILFILVYLFFQFNKKIQNIEIPVEDKRMQQVRFFNKHYLISAWMLTILISLWIYPDPPRALDELMIFLLLVPSIYLYERILTKELKQYILPIIIIFLLDKAQLFVDLNDSLIRILLLVKSVVTIWLLYMIVNPKKTIRQQLHGNWWDFVYKVSYIFLGVSLVSFLANVFGYLNLAILFSRLATYGILIGILLSLEIGIAISFLIMLFQSKFMKGLNLVKNHQHLIEKRISLLLQLYALFLWLRAITNILGAQIFISNWFSGLMDSSLRVGTVSISFGGIINFFLITIVSSLLAKAIRGILEEELFPRIKLPRGVPGAISMVVRYFIIGWGMYVALESAGIDLGTFGLLAGALGVGIGFGLQNIVANFISGLILTFERPIQTGDTIEVGTLMGDVKEIGVRASTIKTFDGSEVIVPNNNLITHEVINWTLSDRKRRRDIEISAAYGTNPRKVLEIINKVASDHPSVMKNPGVWATFEGFGASSLNFKVRFWVSFDIGLTVKSEVAMNIYDAFEEAGIRIPFPQQDLHIKSFDPTVQKTIFPGFKNTDEDDIEKK